MVIKPSYEVRFTFGGLTILVAMLTAAAIVGLLLVPRSETIPVSLCFLWTPLGTIHIVVTLVAMANDRVAVRVDERGIEMRYLYPFFDRIAAVNGVDLATMTAPWGTFDTITFPRKSGDSKSDLTLWAHRRGERRPVLGVPEAGWRLDRARFVAAVKHHAPTVEILD